MNHLERALDKQNQFWKYLVNFLVGFLAGNIVGSIPLALVVLIKTVDSKGSIVPNPDNIMDFSAFGISSNLSLILIMLPFVVGLIFSAFMLKPLHNRTFTEVINGTKSIRWGHFLIGFAVWFIVFSIYFVISYLLDPANFEFQLNWRTFLPLLLISFLLIPFQTAFEEFMFRGYLAQAVGAWTRSRWLVVIVPSLLFGLLHVANPEVKEFGFWNAIPQYVFFGLVFGLIAVFDDGIETAVGVHAANNIFLSLFITTKSSVLQTAAVFEQKTINIQTDTISLVIVGISTLIILRYIFKWDWKILSTKIKQEKLLDETII
jgi:membrane protease YdiL (CAAX protease family)